MFWLNRFHDDHMAVVRLLAKLEGNLKDLEHGEAGVNAIWDLREFAEVIRDVIIPHFKNEEKTTYPKASGVGEEAREFMMGMYKEHDDLYEAFEGFFKALGGETDEKEPAGKDKTAARIISASVNAGKEEAPKNIERVVQVKYLDEEINKGEILEYGYKIVRLLKEHIENEETTVAELVKKADEAGRD